MYMQTFPPSTYILRQSRRYLYSAWLQGRPDVRNGVARKEE